MATVTVAISQDLLAGIFEGAKRLYPKETLFFLRGKKHKDTISITELVIPPLAVYGHGFASFPLHMLPADFSLMGTVHSHPSGDLTPSDVDFNHCFGRILMIVGFPFEDARNVVVYGASGQKLQLQITQT